MIIGERSGARIWAVLLAIAVTPFAESQNRGVQPPKTVRLYVFNCGSLDLPDLSRYELTKEEVSTNLMSVPCFLIAHPRGTLMWDVGVVPDADFRSDGSSVTLGYATAVKPLRAQMAEVGYRPADITFLALSHFHYDHVANANAFSEARWLVRQPERDIMFADPPSTRTVPANYSALKNAKTVIINKDEHDVFGDGTVIVKAAPGHSPAHQVLFLKLAKTGPVVLSGDLYHYPEERKLHRFPTTEFDRAQTAASRKTIDAFLQKTGAQLWIQHDFKANAALKKAPSYYE